MKRLLNFFKTTLVGGLLVVLPLAVAVMLLDAGLKKIDGLLDPIADLLPEHSYITAIGRYFVTVLVYKGYDENKPNQSDLVERAWEIQKRTERGWTIHLSAQSRGSERSSQASWRPG